MRGPAHRRLRAVRSQLRDGLRRDRERAEPAGVGGAESDVAARSVSFLASLVRAQTDVAEGEPCPGEVSVQRAISTRLAELGASVTDM